MKRRILLNSLYNQGRNKEGGMMDFIRIFFCSFGSVTFVSIDRMERTLAMSIFITHPVTKCHISVVVRHLFSFNLCVHFARYKVSASLKMGPIGCPETSVRNCYCSLLNSPEEHSSHLSTRHDIIPLKTKSDCFM